MQLTDTLRQMKRPPRELPRARVVRFLMTGGACALVQFVGLEALRATGMSALLANAIALLLSSQVNFVLSARFTWADRWTADVAGTRWMRFMAAISGTMLLNFAVFAAAHLILPNLIAAMIGTAAGAIANYLIGDRAVFVDRGDRWTTIATTEQGTATEA